MNNKVGSEALNTGLFKKIVGVLTTCHTQYTWDRNMCLFLFNRTTLQVFVTYLTGALYVHTLWFYKHQYDNRVRSKLFVACQWWWFQVVLISTFSSGIHTQPVSWNCVYQLRMELSDGGSFPNLVRNCIWAIAPRQSFWITLYKIVLVSLLCIRHKCYLQHRPQYWPSSISLD